MSRVIAIDGPASSGKGTLAAALSKNLNILNIDTGATYRCLALASLRNNISPEDDEDLINLSGKINIELKTDGKVFLDGEDVTNLIRSKEVSNIVSKVSFLPEVRTNMVGIQRKMAENHDVVLEGRDITTVVFPNADYKFYLDASIEERARRRFKQCQEKGIDMSYEEIYENIKMRDHDETLKTVGGLKRTDDQIYIDSTNMTCDEVTNEVLKIIRGEKHES